jgi:hypothetical protein
LRFGLGVLGSCLGLGRWGFGFEGRNWGLAF